MVSAEREQHLPLGFKSVIGLSRGRPCSYKGDALAFAFVMGPGERDILSIWETISLKIGCLRSRLRCRRHLVRAAIPRQTSAGKKFLALAAELPGTTALNLRRLLARAWGPLLSRGGGNAAQRRRAIAC
jgi:hypothetical protein